jgi:radical SAM protein with 4Fe4S-binding SPASM domain
MLDKDLFGKIVDELTPTLLYMILYFQGEPYLHPDFFDLVSYSTKRNIYTATSTNAHYLDSENARKTVESGLDRLIISIDGTDQDSYEKYRVGGSLHKVIEGTKNLIHWKKKLKSKTPHTIFQFLVFRQNENQINEIQRLGKECNVDEVALKTAQIYDYENGSELLPLNTDYSRYAKNGDGSWKIKNKLLDHCWKMWHSTVITWDGKVVPCCFDKDAKHVMGDSSESTFRSIWESSAYNQFRQQVLGSRSEIDICRNCTEGSKVWT